MWRCRVSLLWSSATTLLGFTICSHVGHPGSEEPAMKATNILKLTLKGLIILLMVFSFAQPLLAQEQESAYAQPYDQYSREELAQMLAPIALYPDTLLSQVLMASTYPIELIEADRWVRQSPELKYDELDNALLSKSWDPSVKALCHFPSILALMSERISETTDLGNAFLAQEEEVLDMVQELRSSARAEGNLASSDQQKVIVENEAVIIEPANPQVIYVPYYDPYYVYGSWWYPAYPPYFWGPPGVSFGISYSYWPGFYFGFSFTNWSYFDWHGRYVYIDAYRRPGYVRHDHWASNPGRWNHSPRHRRGVAYGDRYTARKYSQRPYRQGQYRDGTHGYPERDGRALRSTDRNRTRNQRTERYRAAAVSSTDNRDRQDQRFTKDKRPKQQVERQRTQLTSSSRRERVEAELKLRQQSERVNQGRARVATGQQRQAPEADKVGRSRVLHKGAAQQRTERMNQERARAPSGQQRQPPVAEKARRSGVQPKDNPRQQIEQNARYRTQARVKGQKQENLSNWRGAGRQVRTESQRGSGSSQGRSDWSENSRNPWNRSKWNK